MTKPSVSRYTQSLKASGLTIYDPIEIGDPTLWIPSDILSVILNKALKGVSLAGLPLRTRSKVVKEKICSALGYPIPSTFKKTQPRFLGQCFDTYIQKSNNLQVWNEELSSTRRYVVIKVTENDIIEAVRVVNGDTLAILDTTGTLTQKYQARLTVGKEVSELISKADTDRINGLLSGVNKLTDPTDFPTAVSLLPIGIIYKKLQSLIGKSFPDAGSDQERNRGGLLHKMICQSLGYKAQKDNGQFPDIPNQLLEVKLQTSPTIDLGLVTPDSKEILDMPKIDGRQIRHCDVRYAIFSAVIQDGKVTLTNFFLATGSDFFSRFPRFEGKVLNKKLQIPLPKDFFNYKPKAE